MATKSYWQRFQRERISRRRLLVATGAGATGLAVVAACGGGGDGTDADETPGAELGDPVRGGRYIYSTNGDWGTIDPVTSVGFAPAIFPRLYNVLVEQSRRDPSFFFADLAETLPEQVDEETYNYTIRPGVKIAPNDLGIPERDLDAFDAESWLKRISEDERAVHRAFTNQWLQSFEASDATNFQIKTAGPYSYFLPRLGSPLGGCMPPKEFAEQEISLESQGVGAGPFRIQAGTFEETGEIILERNTNYYRMDERTGEQLPYVDEFQAVRLDDRSARRAAFQTNQISTYTAETADEVTEIRAAKPDLQVFEDPSNTFIAFSMNPTKPPWDNADIRKAAMFALNRQDYVDIIVGPEGGQVNGLVHWSLGPFALSPEELDELQPFDPERSKQLIRDATGEDTIKIKVIYPVTDIQFHDKHLPIWLQQMAAAGFDVEEDPMDFGTWLLRYQNVEYDASLALNQIYETAEVPMDWHSKNGPQGGGEFAIGIGELLPEIEQAISDTKAIIDPEEQIANIHEVQKQIYEAGPAFLPIMTWNSFVLRQGAVKNWPRGIGASNLYLTDWWLDTGTA